MVGCVILVALGHYAQYIEYRDSKKNEERNDGDKRPLPPNA